MGNVGQVMFFVLTLAALGIIGSIVFGYCSRCFLAVTQDAASGNTEMVWGDEPLMDWIFQGAYLLYLIAIPLAPVGITLRTISPDFFVKAPVLAASVFGILLWLLFPIIAMSSMSAESAWIVFRWPILKRLLGSGSTFVTFYLLSFLLLVLGMGPWLLVVATGSILWLIPAALCSAASMLIYARLLGRWAWIISGIRPGRRKRPVRRDDIRVPEAEEPEEEIELIDEPVAQLPEAAPVIEPEEEPFVLPTGDDDVEELAINALLEDDPPLLDPEPKPVPKTFGEVEGELTLQPMEEEPRRSRYEEIAEELMGGSYELEDAPEPQPEPRRRKHRVIDDDTDGYEIEETEPVERPKVDVPVDRLVSGDDDEEEEEEERPRAVRKQGKKPRKAPHSLIPQVLSFPFSEAALPVLMVVAIGQGIVGAFIKLLIDIVPK